MDDEKPAKKLSEQERWAKYLRDRFLGTQTVGVGSIDTLQTVQIEKQVARWGISIWPAANIYEKIVAITAAATLGLTFAQPTVGIVQDGIDEARIGIDAVSDAIFGVPTETVERSKIILKEKTVTRNVPVTREVSRELGRQSPNAAGEFIPDVNLINSISSELDGITNTRGIITSIIVEGTSSDEWGSLTGSIGKPNVENVRLAQTRANEIATLLRINAQTNGTELPEITTRATEAILTPDDLLTLENLTQQIGYESSAQVFNEYKRSPDQLPPVARDFLDIKFGKVRGVTITVSYLTREMTTEEVTLVVPVEVRETFEVEVPRDVVPSDTDHDHSPNPIWLIPPPLPIPFRRKQIDLVEEERIVSEPIEDRVWLKLYPEARKNGNTLDKDAAFETRAVKYLMKNDRFHSVLLFDYLDSEGKAQTIRVGFVDHDPTEQAIAAIERTLTQACKIHGGKIAERFGLIMMVPDDSTGPQFDVEKIGLGIDEQYPSAVLGVAIPAIGLIQVQMDIDSSTGEIRNFSGMEWTLAHEISHFADVINQEMQLHPVPDIPNGYYTSNPWEHHGLEMYISLIAETGGEPRWHISVPFYDEEGNLQLETVVMDELPENYATWGEIRKMGFPTRYSTTHEAELFAETGAAVITGIPIPFDEHKPSSSIPDSIAGEQVGYRPDPRLREHFARVVGANPMFNPVSSRLSFSIDYDPCVSVTVGKPEDVDPFFAKKIREAKVTELPQDHELLNILAGVRQTSVEHQLLSSRTSTVVSSSRDLGKDTLVR